MRINKVLLCLIALFLFQGCGIDYKLENAKVEKTGNQQQSIEEYKNIIANYKDNEKIYDAYFAIAKIYLTKKEYDLAKQNYEIVVDKTKNEGLRRDAKNMIDVILEAYKTIEKYKTEIDKFRKSNKLEEALVIAKKLSELKQDATVNASIEDISTGLIREYRTKIERLSKSNKYEEALSLAKKLPDLKIEPDTYSIIEGLNKIVGAREKEKANEKRIIEFNNVYNLAVDIGSDIAEEYKRPVMYSISQVGKSKSGSYYEYVYWGLQNAKNSNLSYIENEFERKRKAQEIDAHYKMVQQLIENKVFKDKVQIKLGEYDFGNKCFNISQSIGGYSGNDVEIKFNRGVIINSDIMISENMAEEYKKNNTIYCKLVFKVVSSESVSEITKGMDPRIASLMLRSSAKTTHEILRCNIISAQMEIPGQKDMPCDLTPEN